MWSKEYRDRSRSRNCNGCGAHNGGVGVAAKRNGAQSGGSPLNSRRGVSGSNMLIYNLSRIRGINMGDRWRAWTGATRSRLGSLQSPARKPVGFAF